MLALFVALPRRRLAPTRLPRPDNVEGQRHLDSGLVHHHYSYFGPRLMRSITATYVLGWISTLREKEAAQSSVCT